MGLSTCFGIVKQSGGHINVSSQPGQGACFTVYLTAAKPDGPLPSRPLVGNDLPGGKETLLLVEEDAALREMATSLLRRLGYIVLAAADASQALSLQQENPTRTIDALFTYLASSPMSGPELSKLVRRLSPGSRTLYSSHHTQSQLEPGSLSKGVGFLQKPFTPSSLAGRLRKLLDESD